MIFSDFETDRRWIDDGLRLHSIWIGWIVMRMVMLLIDLWNQTVGSELDVIGVGELELFRDILSPSLVHDDLV